MSHPVDMSTLKLCYICKDSKFTFNTGLPALTIKFIQVVLGVICFGLATNDIFANLQELVVLSAAVISGRKLGWVLDAVKSLFKPFVDFDHVFIDQLTCRIVYLAVTVIFLIISLVQLIWFPTSFYSGSLKARTVSGVIYHLTGSALHLLASMFVFARIDLLGTNFYNVDFVRLLAIIGSVNAVLYLLSTILALWSSIEKKYRRRELPVEANLCIYHTNVRKLVVT